MIQPRLSIVTLGVDDMTRAKAFYLDGLGWTEIEQPSANVCFIQMPGMMLGLYGLDALAEDMAMSAGDREAGLGQFWGCSFAYNTATKEETDAVMAEAVAAGATLVKAPEEVFWGGYSGYFSDPDGHLWEVAYNPFTLPGPDGSFVMQ